MLRPKGRALEAAACVDQARSQIPAPSSLPPPLQVPAPGSAATLVPRLLRAAVALLDEGGLEARTAGKRMLWMLRAQLDSSAAGGDDFKRSLAKLDCKTDKASAGSLQSCSGWGALRPAQRAVAALPACS